MIPTDTTIQFQTVLLLIIQVDTSHLRSCQSLTTTTPTTTSIGGEAHIIDIIGTSHQKDFQIVFHPSSHSTTAITVVGTGCQVGVQHKTFVHAWLDAKIKHRLLFTIINTADTCQVALLVVGSHTFYDRGGQVLHSSLRIAYHEFLTIYLNLLDFLSIDGYLAIIVNLCTR